MWKFLNKVHDGDHGGCGLLIAFAILCSAICIIIQSFLGKG